MYDIITIGTATRDVFLKSPLFRVLRDPQYLLCFALGSKIEINPPIFTTGGGATNAAVTFSRQNLKVATLIKIGLDESAEYILKELRREKIVSLAVKNKKQKTAYATILLAPTGERTILVYRGASEDLKIKEIPFNKLKSQWAYISPGTITFPVIQRIFNHFRENKTLIAFNPSKYFLEMGIKKLKPLLNKTKVVILNREEAAVLAGIDYQKEKEIFKKLDEVVEGIAIMTQGAKGVLVSDGTRIYQAKAFRSRKVIDRTGAGDAFASGFVAGLIRSQSANRPEAEQARYGAGKAQIGRFAPSDLQFAIRLGSANATSVIEHIGAKEGILTKKESQNPRWRLLRVKIIKIK